jgi:hypothetical protein
LEVEACVYIYVYQCPVIHFGHCISNHKSGRRHYRQLKRSSEMCSEVAEGMLDISELLENRVRSRSTYLFEIERRRVDIETSFLSDLAPG